MITAEDNGPNLFGANWFKPFGIQVVGIQTVENADPDYKAIIKAYPGLHKKELSGHKGTPIHIDLKTGTSPKFFKARRVPYAMTKAVNEALRDMEKDGMISPIDQSDWATPVIFVKKVEWRHKSSWRL